MGISKPKLVILFALNTACLACDPSTLTFRDWAVRTLPTALQRSVKFLSTLNSTSLPDSIKDLRVSLLETRELLDVFSAVYPAVNVDSKKKEVDFWYELRRDLDTGYELLGAFQDLAHSLVRYNATDADRAREPCLKWQEEMYKSTSENNFMQYLEKPLNGTFVEHEHQSRLFWGYKGIMPQAKLTGLQNIGRLLAKSQVQQLLDTYPRILELRQIFEEPEHTQFHDFRKLVRSMLAVILYFPELMPEAGAPPILHSLLHGAIGKGVNGSNANHTRGHGGAHVHSHSEGAAALSHSHSRTLTQDEGGAEEEEESGSDPAGALEEQAELRQALAEEREPADGDGRGRSIGRGSGGSRGLRRKMLGKSKMVTLDTVAVSEEGGVIKCDAWQAHKDFQELFKDLGLLNNKIYAYEFYSKRGMVVMADQQRNSLEEGWLALLSDMQQTGIEDLARCLADTMP